MTKIKYILEVINTESVIQFLSKYKSDKGFDNTEFKSDILYTQYFVDKMQKSQWYNDSIELFDPEIDDEVTPQSLIGEVVNSLMSLDVRTIDGNTGVEIERAMGIENRSGLSRTGVGVYWAFAGAEAYWSGGSAVIFFGGIGSLNDLDFDTIIGSGIDRAIVSEDFENELRFKAGSTVIIDRYKETESGEWINIDPIHVIV